MRALAESTGMMKELGDFRKNKLSMDSIKAYKNTVRKLASWAALAQGKSVKSLTDDKFGNAWLYNPTILKSGRLYRGFWTDYILDVGQADLLYPPVPTNFTKWQRGKSRFIRLPCGCA